MLLPKEGVCTRLYTFYNILRITGGFFFGGKSIVARFAWLHGLMDHNMGIEQDIVAPAMIGRKRGVV